MAWWEPEDRRPSLADQLADSSRPMYSEGPDGDRSDEWGGIPLWLLLGAVLVTAGGVLLASVPVPAATGFAIGLIGWGAFFLTQFGILGWFALRVGSLRERRVEVERRGARPVAVTDHDVRCWYVPRRWGPGGLMVGRLSAGDARVSRPVRVARTIGAACIAVFIGGLAFGSIASVLGRAVSG